MSAATTIPAGFQSTKASGSLVFQNPSSWKKADLTGRMVQGIYLGRTEPDSFQKKNYKFKATVGGQALGSNGELVEYAEGADVIINESGSLNKALESAEIGDEVIVDYDGPVKIKKGAFKGKEAHTFSAYIRKVK